MEKHDGIPFDGFGTVIEMLHNADAAFCEKIIRNIALKDRHLAERLQNALRAADQKVMDDSNYEESLRALQRGQRAAVAKTYRG